MGDPCQFLNDPAVIAAGISVATSGIPGIPDMVQHLTSDGGTAKYEGNDGTHFFAVSCYLTGSGLPTNYVVIFNAIGQIAAYEPPQPFGEIIPNGVSFLAQGDTTNGSATISNVSLVSGVFVSANAAADGFSDQGDIQVGMKITNGGGVVPNGATVISVTRDMSGNPIAFDLDMAATADSVASFFVIGSVGNITLSTP